MRVVFLKSQSKIANQSGYYFKDHRWHKISDAKPAPAHHPIASHPEVAGQFAPASHFTDEQWQMLKLPDTNVNAKPVNKKIDELKHYSDTGNIAAILGMSIGSNTYGKQVAMIANTLLDMYGVEHKVQAGQKAGTHAAISLGGLSDDAPAVDNLVTKESVKEKPKPKNEEKKPDAGEVYQFKKGDKVKFGDGFFTNDSNAGQSWSVGSEYDGKIIFVAEFDGSSHHATVELKNIKNLVDAGKLAKLGKNGHPLSQLKTSNKAAPEQAAMKKNPPHQKEHFIGLWGLTPSNQEHNGDATATWENSSGEKVTIINDTKKGKIYVGFNDGQRGFNSGYQYVDTTDEAEAALPKLTHGGVSGIPEAVKDEFNSYLAKNELSVGKDKQPAKADIAGPNNGDTKPGADGSTLVFKDGHWHKKLTSKKAVVSKTTEKPAEPTPSASGSSLSEKLDMIQMDKDKLPESNSNAKTHNAAIDKIKAMAMAGDLAGLQAFHAKKSAMKQNYALKQAKLAAVVIAALEEHAGDEKPPAPAEPEKTKPVTKKKPKPKPEPKQEPVSGDSPAEPSAPIFAKGSAMDKVVKNIKSTIGSVNIEKLSGLIATTAAFTSPNGKLVHAYAKNALMYLASIGAKSKDGESAILYAEAMTDEAKPARTNDVKWDIEVNDEGMSGATTLKANVGDVFVYVGKDADDYQVGTMDYDTGDFDTDDATSLVNALHKLAEKVAFLGGEPPSYSVVKDYAAALGAPICKEATWNDLVNDAKQKFKVEVDDGPHDGDTKQGADGMLVFHDGHWRKKDDHTGAELSGPASVGVPKFNNGLLAKNKSLLVSMANALKQTAIDSGKAGFTKHVTAHKDGTFTIHAGGAKIKNASPKSSDPAIADLVVFVGKLKDSLSDVKASKPQKQAPTSEPVSEFDSIDQWTQVGGQLGSNAGGKYKDPSGQEWYCKFPDNEHTAKAEVLAAKLYGLAGIAGQDAKLITKDGKVGIASKWTDVNKATPAQLAKNKTVIEGFAVDAWLANWDVVGLGYDNLQHDKDGKALRIDAGGSLMYRAQGGKKEFGDHVPEIDTLRDPAINPQAAAVFGKISKADITASVAKVLKVHDDDIKALVDQFGPGDDAEKAALVKTLIARKDYLASKYPAAAKKVKKYLDPHALPVNEDRLPKRHDFDNFNGPSLPLSSKEHVNKANADTEKAMMAIAAKGDMVALQNFKFQPIDKETGAPIGGLKPISEYPSKHVVQYHQDLMQVLDEVANPPEPLKVFKDQDFSSLEILSKAFGPKKFGTTVESVASNEKLGFWIALGVAHSAPASLKPKKVMNFAQDAIDKAYVNYKKMTSLAKHFVKSVQASGSYNDLFRDGKKKDSFGYQLKDVAKAALGAAVEQPEGTTIYRWQHMTDAMVKHILSSQDGMVFQATGPMCTSYSPSATSGFGKHRITVRYAKGAKAVESFGSGSFQSEKEVTTLPNARFLVLSKKMVPDEKKVGSQRLELEVLMLPPDLGL